MTHEQFSIFLKNCICIIYICCSYFVTLGIFHIFPLFQLCQNTLPYPKTKEKNYLRKKLAATYMYFFM